MRPKLPAGSAKNLTSRLQLWIKAHENHARKRKKRAKL